MKKEEPEERVSEKSSKDEDEAMETEREVNNKQQQEQQQPIGPARPVQPAPVSAPPAEVHVCTSLWFMTIILSLLHQMLIYL